MDIEAFRKSIDTQDGPSHELSDALAALWWDAKGDWGKAHELCQREGTQRGDWVHAYLHRSEGDEGNAAYWYQRAGKPFFEGGLAEEWEAIARTLL